MSILIDCDRPAGENDENDENVLNDENDQLNGQRGAIGYIFLWLMGVPAGILFLILLMRG